MSLRIKPRLQAAALCLVACCLAGASSMTLAADAPESKPDDSRALAGVETGKVAWDINMGNPEKLTLYLKVMNET